MAGRPKGVKNHQWSSEEEMLEHRRALRRANNKAYNEKRRQKLELVDKLIEFTKK